ncbi:Ornithine decarboxylase [Seminavis robusta]|uniref:Ornithine decarboxylase n=1 Tax=Seminavis robusta TaxID=568900 RepID=A0A9N8GZH9_9STRA|nr:Ornithine decarboxylase [Seminavis robusta]|eukprot:Sro4_g003330.1 Ornithine decarboxylase (589) ;mRNA; f:121433-123199
MPTKDRATARSQVAQQWASRRQERSSIHQQQQSRSSITSSQRPPSITLVPSLCHAIGKAWQEAVANIANAWIHTNDNNHNNNKLESDTTGTNNNKFKGTFPSVLQILQASALQEQVEQFAPENEEEKEALRVLPAGYDWNQAIWNMAESRSRAFLLLDLASIVPVLVQWKRQLPSSPNNKIAFLYTVQYNANPKLLQLLLRSQVGLVCTNKWDLIKCRQAVQQLADKSISWNDKNSNIIHDNASQIGKPDGYLRQLILDDDDGCGVKTVVVDGPQEVTRIMAALERMRKRRRRQTTTHPEQPSETTTMNDNQDLYFLLRLPETAEKETQQAWLDLVDTTTQQIAKEQTKSVGKLSLVGISLDVAAYLDQTGIENLLDRVEEDYLQHFATKGPGVRLDLTGVTMPPTEETLDFWKTLAERPNLAHITVDVSHALVSPAGALCTRIIGVRQIKQDDNNNNESKKNDDKTSIQMHYYIDDGCYGSLYTAAEHNAISNPLPLGVDHGDDDEEDKNDNDSASLTFTSTVWGPTCDGLDRVCRDIPLPKLHRDQWLVFPNLGCHIGEGLGTQFNGFDPPDTAYCVLGYWGSTKQ